MELDVFSWYRNYSDHYEKSLGSHAINGYVLISEGASSSGQTRYNYKAKAGAGA